MSRHVRRLARRVPICLALGLASTVVLAWALALWLPHRSLARSFNAIRPAEDDRFGMIWVREFSRPGMIRREWRYDERSAGGGTTRLEELRAETARERKPDTRASYSWGDLRRAVQNPERALQGVEDSRGWPWPAFWCTMDHARGPGSVGFAAEGGVGVEWYGPATSLAEFRAIPLRPVWWGLVADAALWACAWFAALEVARTGVRSGRRWRGRCLDCGYDLRSLIGACCPECGASAKAPAAAAARP